MAEDQDDAQKTEEPTQKRLQDARDKGQIASSREVGNFMMLTTATLLLATIVPTLMQRLSTGLTPYLSSAAEMPMDPSALGGQLLSVLTDTMLILAVPLGAFAAAGIIAAAVQNGIVWTTEPMTPKFEKISPLAGVKRLFSLKSLVEFAKNLAKMSLIAAIGLAVIWPDKLRLVVSGRLEIAVAMSYLHDLLVWLLATLSAALALLAGLDYAYQRFEHLEKMRMSRRDIQDEHKQSEGDPMIKQRLRALRMERARQRMMAEVPKSTVVVTNPTHVSVALRYNHGEDSAPIVVAKGTDHLALRIREIARAHDVPIVENPPLARALNANAEIGGAIPESHYRAAAEVIGYVMRLRQGS